MVGGELAWQVGDETWTCDSRASTHLTPSADNMTNCRERNLKLHINDGATTRSIEGYGDNGFFFRSEKGPLDSLLSYVAHVPGLRYNLFSHNDVIFDGRPTGMLSD